MEQYCLAFFIHFKSIFQLFSKGKQVGTVSEVSSVSVPKKKKKNHIPYVIRSSQLCQLSTVAMFFIFHLAIRPTCGLNTVMWPEQSPYLCSASEFSESHFVCLQLKLMRFRKKKPPQKTKKQKHNSLIIILYAQRNIQKPVGP